MEYFTSNHWFKRIELLIKICHYVLKLIVQNMKRQDKSGSRSGSGAKNTRNGKQAKKPKVETESRNIKDMFSKAAKRKR